MKTSRTILLFLYSFAFLMLANVLHAFFLPQKKFEPVNITYKVESDFDTWTWLSAKSSNGETLKTVPVQIFKNKPITISETISNKQGIKFTGIYWNYSNKGSFKVQDISIKSNRKEINYSTALHAIKYQSDNLNINLHENALLATSSIPDTANGWLMLKEGGIQKVSAFKWFKPFSLVTNVILFIVSFLFILWNKFSIDLVFFSEKWNIIKIRLTILFLWMFLLPFWPIVSHILLGLSIIATIIHYRKRADEFNLKTLKYCIPIAVVFFAIVFIDIIFHIEFLIKDIAHYSYLIVTPLIFLGLKKEHFKNILRVLNTSTLLYVILFLVACCERYINGDHSITFNEYVFETLNTYWHTSYFAGLLIIPILFLLKEKQWTLKNITLVVFALGFLTLTKARLPLILSLLIIIGLSLSFINSRQIKIVFIAVFSGVTLFSSYLLFYTNIGNEVIRKVITTDKQQVDVRPEIWTAALKAIDKQLWTGYGSKNVRKTIVANLDSQSKIKLRNYNAHNQYLEWCLSHGIIITFILLTVILITIFTTYKSRYYFIYIALAMIVESYLVRQSGIILFSLFYSFFIMYDHKD